MTPAGSPITTHVLDTARGRPAAGVAIMLEEQDPATGAFLERGRGVTDSDGRNRALLDRASFRPGVWRITFALEDYFRAHGTEGFYPSASIVFRVKDASEHYHVPLLLSPYGYSTYRGS